LKGVANRVLMKEVGTITEVTDIITPGNENAFTVGERTRISAVSELHPFHRQLIEGPFTATVATYDSSGKARLNPMWWDTDGTHIRLNTRRGRLKWKNLSERREVSIQAIDPADPYHWITVYGTVVDVVDEEDPERGHLATESIDDLGEIYLGQRPYPFREPDEVRVLFLIRPDKIVTFGAPS
jgi:PPOX class probable F420-dependent enzyme